MTFQALKKSFGASSSRITGSAQTSRDSPGSASTLYLNGGASKLVDEFTEVESGKRNARPELQKALAACRKHKAKLGRVFIKTRRSDVRFRG